MQTIVPSAMLALQQQSYGGGLPYDPMDMYDDYMPYPPQPYPVQPYGAPQINPATGQPYPVGTQINPLTGQPYPAGIQINPVTGQPMVAPTAVAPAAASTWRIPTNIKNLAVPALLVGAGVLGYMLLTQKPKAGQ